MADQGRSSSPKVFRFVVLRHAIETHTAQLEQSIRTAPVHCDWMFQVGDSLLTWSTYPVPDFAGDLNLEAIKLPNHRTEYLEIQGDIGGQRGHVSRLVRGELNSLVVSEDRYEADLHWPQVSDLTITRHLEIQRISDADSWRLRLDRGL